MRESYFKITAPCKECPFVKGSPRGWLGPDGVEDVVRKVHGEGGYACHMSLIGAPKDSEGFIDIRVEGNGRQCTGAVLHALKTHKLYYDDQLSTLQSNMALELWAEWKDKILGFDFREYHESGILARAEAIRRKSE